MATDITCCGGADWDCSAIITPAERRLTAHGAPQIEAEHVTGRERARDRRATFSRRLSTDERRRTVVPIDPVRGVLARSEAIR
jgi:hypothetical protein